MNHLIYRRTNWSGAALSTFYTAVRQALLVAIIIRALATGIGFASLAWLIYKRFGAGVGYGVGLGAGTGHGEL